MPAAEIKESDVDGPVGLGGWLILLGLRLVSGFAIWTFAMMGAPSMVTVGMTVLCGLLLWTFFTKAWLFPPFYLAVDALTMLMLFGTDVENPSSRMRVFLFELLWVLYLFRSRRVDRTFVR